jgi:PAS domain S-box-containing protein
MNTWEIIKIIGQLLGVLGIGAILKKAYKKFKINREVQRNYVKEQFELVQERMRKQDFELLKIVSQLYPNGGSSLYDHIISLKFAQKNTWEVLDMAVWESDKEGRVTYVTTTLCRLIGWTPAELLDDSWQGKVEHDEREDIVDEWMQSVETSSLFNREITFVRSDGLHQKVTAIAIHNKERKLGEVKVISSLCRLVKLGEPYVHKRAQ